MTNPLFLLPFQLPSEENRNSLSSHFHLQGKLGPLYPLVMSPATPL